MFARNALVLSVVCGCGAATGIPVGERGAQDASIVPSVDAGQDAPSEDVNTPPMDAELDGPFDAEFDAEVDAPFDAGDDSSGNSVLCAWRAFVGAPISQIDCSGGEACVPVDGCVPTGSAGTPLSSCGGLACASACACVADVCNCAN